jgi:hypothetical protein
MGPIDVSVFMGCVFMAQQPLVGQDLFIIETSLLHWDTPHSSGFIRTRDQPDLTKVHYIGNGFFWKNEPEHSSANNKKAVCICSQLFGGSIIGKA